MHELHVGTDRPQHRVVVGPGLQTGGQAGGRAVLVVVRGESAGGREVDAEALAEFGVAQRRIGGQRRAVMAGGGLAIAFAEQHAGQLDARLVAALRHQLFEHDRRGRVLALGAVGAGEQQLGRLVLALGPQQHQQLLLGVGVVAVGEQRLGEQPAQRRVAGAVGEGLAERADLGVGVHRVIGPERPLLRKLARCGAIATGSELGRVLADPFAA